MPELPEVETVRRTLEPRILEHIIDTVSVRRRDVIEGPASPAHLLRGDAVRALVRRGKQLAIIGASGRVLVVQLGMTGSLVAGDHEPDRSDPHVHVVWRLRTAQRTDLWLRFRDPRRFGGVSTLASESALDRRWSELGPDALDIGDEALAAGLAESRRPIKAALLDQRAIAGVGNIYADEALFRARVRPSRRCDRLRDGEWRALAAELRAVLTQAIERGGSTLRDYRNGDGDPGEFQQAHLVYARAGRPCFMCSRALKSTILAGRTTVYCQACQPAASKRPSVIHRGCTLADALTSTTSAA